MANELARTLATQLQNAALNWLISEAEAGNATKAQVDAWVAANRTAVEAGVKAALPPLPAISERLPSAPSADGWRPAATFGPATVSVDCPAATITVAGTAIPIGLLPPNGASLTIEAGAVRGAGALVIEKDRVSGSLMLRMGVADVAAFAVLDVNGTPSLTLVLGVRFVPPVQLSFGFALTAVGGVIGVNRRLDTDALRARLADGSALDALFPTDPKTSAGAVLATLGSVFAAAPGEHVIGPTVTITWLDLGAVSLVRLDVGVLLSLPSGTITIIGRGQIQLPPVLHIRMDVLGVIDAGRSIVAVDAVLVDSHLLGIFDVTGTAALRMCWGAEPYFVLTVGGFYPGFRPEPALLPPQQRLGLHLAVPCPLTLRAEGYFAITANTVQAGARIQAGFDLGFIEAHGAISFDAIVTLDPFHVHADYSAEWHVEVAIFEVGTTVSGWIDGPGPWTIHARVSISLLIDSFDWSDTFTIGSAGPPAAPAHATICDALRPVLAGPSRFTASAVDDPLVDVRPRLVAQQGSRVLTSPLAELTWTQDVVPLDLPVRRVGGRRLASEQQASVTVTGPNVQDRGNADGWFAPTVYTDLTSAETLGQPTYQRLAAGRVVALANGSGPKSSASLDYIDYFRRSVNAWDDGPFTAKPYLQFDRLVVQGVAAQASRATVAERSPQVTVTHEAWAVTSNGHQPAGAASAIHGLMTARATGGVLHAAAEPAITVGAI